MSRRATQILWGVIALGVVLRLALAFGFYGYAYDVDSLRIVRFFLGAEGLGMYGEVNAVEPVVRWPYPPGFLPAIVGFDWLAGVTPLPFHGLIQLPTIAADAGLAYLVQRALGSGGASERTRLSAAGLIALGPLFVLVAGYHGQIDSLAILPAVAAFVAWERGGPRRGLVAGVLLGVGAAIKIVPAFLLLALLPHARSRREGVVLTMTTVAIPLASLLPFLVADPAGVRTLAEYSGAPGQGGLTLALQPALAGFYVTGAPFDLNAAVTFLYENGWLAGVLLGGLGIFLLRYRPPPLTGAVIIWVALWALSPAFFFHYLIWGLPFLLLARHLLPAAAIQLVVVVPALLFYLGPSGDWALYVYVPLMLGLWAAMLLALVKLVRSATAKPAIAPAEAS